MARRSLSGGPRTFRRLFASAVPVTTTPQNQGIPPGRAGRIRTGDLLTPSQIDLPPPPRATVHTVPPIALKQQGCHTGHSPTRLHQLVPRSLDHRTQIGSGTGSHRASVRVRGMGRLAGGRLQATNFDLTLLWARLDPGTARFSRATFRTEDGAEGQGKRRPHATGQPHRNGSHCPGMG